MPITAFSGFTDGLEPGKRSREHFIANIDVEDGPHWIPYAEGVWLQPCHFDLTSGGFSVVLKAVPGAKLGTHYHVGTVRGSSNSQEPGGALPPALSAYVSTGVSRHRRGWSRP